MGQVVYAGATSHVGKIARDPDAAPEWSRSLHAAWDEMREEISRVDLDALVIVATDHYETFGLNNYPTFCIGAADRYEAWGEFGNPTGTVPGVPEISNLLLEGLVLRGYDVSRSLDMRLDHSFMVPLTKITDQASIPIVPLFVNCNTPPLPSLQRCFDLGAAIADATTGLPAGTRIGVVGTGGVSHWVGLPRAGEINEDFDREFLGHLVAGRVQTIVSWDDDWILETAGNGALEIRTWLVAMGAAGGQSARLLAYAPMHPWHTGIGILQYDVAA